MTNVTDEPWAALAAPLPPEAMSFRLDGSPKARDGKYFARFVWYYEWPTLLRRLDEAAPGQWDLRLTALPTTADKDGVVVHAFVCRLNVAGVEREDVGEGDSVKSAATDAMKRAARQFGVGLEAWEVEGQLWVQVDGEGKYAKPVEDPARAFARMRAKAGGASQSTGREAGAGASTPSAHEAPVRTVGTHDAARSEAAVERAANAADPYAGELGPCPKCGGAVWDNRATKRNPRAPDGKCKDRNCDGAIWPPRPANGARQAPKRAEKEEVYMDSSPLSTGTDDIPF